MLVPVLLFLMPHRFEVLVKVCWLIRIFSTVRGSPFVAAMTSFSRVTVALRISPTSKAMRPPGLRTRASSAKVSCNQARHASAVECESISTVSMSRSANQQRSQLSVL